MYPILNIPQKTLKISDVTESAKLLVPGKVTSTTFISHGAMSIPIDIENLRGNLPFSQLAVQCNNYETIELEDSCRAFEVDGVHWARAIRLSEDCHNYNIQLRLLPHQRVYPKLVLQTVRPIEAGQELQLWFSEEILAKLQMVFLTPINIQGQKKYVCNKCFTTYESPNPLKLHMTLACGRFSISDIWEKLAFALRETSNFSTERSAFKFNLTTSHNVRDRNDIIDLSKTNSEETKCSAFTPVVVKSEKCFTNNNETYPLTNFHLAERKLDEEAHIETLVSSLGKSKNGHICLYCGKCYSRKYGLKIHIRTHTGYKPLKCKYCFRPFGDPSNLNKHTRLHAEGSTPYKCELCGKILVRRRDLERHLKSRHTSSDTDTESSLKIEDVSDDDDDEDIVLVD